MLGDLGDKFWAILDDVDLLLLILHDDVGFVVAAELPAGGVGEAGPPFKVEGGELFVVLGQII